ncbi:hypothetical protein GCM10011390_47050 [Aureimonas endophytica]|uniref:Activator of Hsp90 ATPase homologue 1/2-like C-terminal domain-containing protein n=1 Tax=Aureimonas endophytica TaxID=2027858 RepID=A0A917A1I7_9HYPH|nr:SRPBCC domain-containing protein [Aureimonas endophytica]GGE22278.1 hypothetical protein GCM10011390_47050 [Aureimonas endophytica]
MTDKQVVVEAEVAASAAQSWDAYTSPDRITQWNFASDDWQCPTASVDLREGGRFSSRMEAKDGSAGFDFSGTYTKLVPNERIEYEFGGRRATVSFTPHGDRTHVRVAFDPEAEHSVDQQRSGWQAILDNFAKHVGATSARG